MVYKNLDPEKYSDFFSAWSRRVRKKFRPDVSVDIISQISSFRLMEKSRKILNFCQRFPCVKNFNSVYQVYAELNQSFYFLRIENGNTAYTKPNFSHD